MTVRLAALVPDKSISHRAAILAAVAAGESRVENYSPADDCLRTVNALRSIGCQMQLTGRVLTARGGLPDPMPSPAGPLDLGNSGTGIRLLLGLFAGLPIHATLTGDESLQTRPMDRIAKPLEKMGAHFEGRGDRLTPPVIVHGARPLKSIQWKLEPASAQVKSAILLATMFAEGETLIEEPVATRDHTERMLSACGVPVHRENGIVRMKGGVRPRRVNLCVPEDFSAAAFFIALGLLDDRLGGIEIEHVGLNPTRTAFLDAVRLMGGAVTAQITGDEAGEPVGKITVKPGALRGIELPLEWVPNLIDEIPVLSILAAAASGKTVVRGAKELRVKESDRIKSIVQMIANFSGAIEERPDGFEITGAAGRKPPSECLIPKVARFATSADHRIAMSVLIAAEAAGVAVTVDNKECINTSFPGFFDCMGEIHAQSHRY